MMEIVIAIVIGVIIVAIYGLVEIVKGIVHSSKNRKAIREISFAINSMQNANTNIKLILFDDNGYKNIGIVVDKRSEHIYIFRRINGTIYKNAYSFSDLISVKIIENDSDVTSDNTLSNALLGGYLGGITGAIVGAGISKKTYIKKVTKLSLVLIFKDMAYPYYRINFWVSKSGVNKDCKAYQTLYRVVEDWYGMFSVIIDKIKM